MDFVVRTRGGRLVRDLKKEDIVIAEDGVRQEIRALIPPVGFTAERGDTRQKSGAVHVGNPRLVVLAFDSMGLEAGKRAADAAVELMRQVPDGSTFFAVAGLQPRLNWWQDFTTAQQSLIAAIRRAAGAAGLAYGVDTGQAGKESAVYGEQSREETARKAVDARLAALNRRAEEFDRQLQGTRLLGPLLALAGAFLLGAPVLFTRTEPCRDEADPLCFARQAAVPELGPEGEGDFRILIRHQQASPSTEPLRLNVSWWREGRLAAASGPSDLEWDQNRPGRIILRPPQQAKMPGRYQVRVLAKHREMQTERIVVVEIRRAAGL